VTDSTEHPRATSFETRSAERYTDSEPFAGAELPAEIAAQINPPDPNQRDKFVPGPGHFDTTSSDDDWVPENIRHARQALMKAEMELARIALRAPDDQLVSEPAKERLKAPGYLNPPTMVQVEAAKLRLVTDRRLGKKSPEWLQRVAKGLPPQNVKAAG